MTMQITRWSPDTCRCVIEYSWDDTVPQNSRTHTLANVVTKCPAHTAQTDSNVYTTLTDENPRKNKVLGHLATTFSTLTTTDASGNVVLKDGVVTWSYDASRVLQITIPSLTTAQKSSTQTWVDTNVGTGKVKVN